MIVCPRCGGKYPGKMVAEEMLVSIATDEVAAATRNFVATCPTHGRFGWQKPGNHGTLQEANLKRMFLKHRATLKARLSKAEWKRFNRAMNGKIASTNEDVARWRAILDESE
ncbi:MAG: hypothetical protein ACXWCP_27800 [Burkholderiales bacterium]